MTIRHTSASDEALLHRTARVIARGGWVLFLLIPIVHAARGALMIDTGPLLLALLSPPIARASVGFTRTVFVFLLFYVVWCALALTLVVSHASTGRWRAAGVGDWLATLLALGTLAWASVSLRLTWRSLAAARRVQRRRAGCCCDCGYPLYADTHTRCPECGRPLTADAPTMPAAAEPAAALAQLYDADRLPDAFDGVAPDQPR